jgi:hypothetical protein
MYNVIDEDYPRLESYLCYECGFHTNTVMIQQKGLYQAYQKLFIHTKEKFGNLLDLKHFHYHPISNTQMEHQEIKQNPFFSFP